jgi:hypothetical protein
MMMKKTVLVILFCVGSILLLHPAHAAETGFSGQIVIGASILTGHLSQLDTYERDKRIDRLDGQSDEVSYQVPYFSGELAYTLSNGLTTFFVTSLNSGADLAAGARQSLTGFGQISLAATMESCEVWQNPYLVGVSRSRTDEVGYGVSIGLQDIMGTRLVLTSQITAVDVDKDLIGEQEKDLHRDGARSTYGAGYAIGLDDRQQIIPMVLYSSDDMDGEANSNDGYALAVSYQLGSGSWGLEASIEMGWTEYRKDHPVFNKTREATSFGASALVGYSGPFGWSHTSIYCLAAYNRIDENIDFFDSEFLTFGIGVGYEF